ncbi:MAG: YveK family protein [Anaerolineae bacterium]
MELRAYWKIIVRRWWLPAGLALLVGLLTLVMQRPWQPRPASFSATMRFNVGLQPERIPGVYTYDRYYTMLTSEYLVDDLGEIVRSQAFAAEVSRRLAGQGITVPAGAIGASTQPGKLHRILTVNVGWGDEAQLRAIADAIAATLTQSGAEFFGQFSADEADIRLIDPPAIGRVGRPAREQLDLPLRVVLALAAGIGLAFLAHYLDNTVREAAELEGMGLTVLGEIPRR